MSNLTETWAFKIANILIKFCWFGLWFGGALMLIVTGEVIFGIYPKEMPMGAGKMAALMFCSMIGLGLYLWGVYQIRKILKSIVLQEVFVKLNAIRIKRIAYAMMIWVPFKWLFFYFSNFSEPTRPQVPGFGPELYSKNSGEVFLIGLFIFLFAQIFETAVRMKEEQDLVV